MPVMPVMPAGPAWAGVDNMASVPGLDQPVRLLAQFTNPEIVVLQHFLSHHECDELVRLARPRLAPSETVADDEDDLSRTSQGMFFDPAENALIRTIDQRIAHCFNWPVTHGEDLQVLRYETGGRYDPHYDYFSASTPDDISGVHLHGQRVATVILYLNEPEQGGDTAFVDRDFRVTPTKGNAVFFSYLSADASSKTLHAGLPVLAGEKWIANKWLRARPF